VLEYAEGGDALHYVQSIGALGEDRARTWSMQVTSAVTYMHDLGIAHRDLKLENLLLTGDLRTIKICDFGFARQKTVRFNELLAVLQVRVAFACRGNRQIFVYFCLFVGTLQFARACLRCPAWRHPGSVIP